MVPEGWVAGQVSDICRLQNGRGFKPDDWDTEGLPIIRIQNLNGSKNFNYFSGEPEEKWLIEPGQMLFAWAGTKGVSFGPTVWRGETGVLNQHIFKVFQKDSVDNDWLYLALRHVTDRVEGKAHGFKATLVHVKKSDIEQQPVAIPPLPEQKKIAEILSTWDRAIETAEALLATARTQKRALMQTLLTGKRRFPEFEGQEWTTCRASEVFETVSIKKRPNEPLLAVTQEQGVVRRDELERRVVMPEGSTEGYKLVVPGNFIISLRSFQGGLEYSDVRGLVSPAYHVLQPKQEVHDAFYKHYFKSYDFIGHLAVAIIGIRDGKQISYADFSFLQIPNPGIAEQQRIGAALDTAQAEVENFEARLGRLRTEKKALMQQLLTGKRRVQV